MILPNKLISFKDCILAKTIYILEKISDSDFSVIELYEKVETHFEDLNEYMLALDVLYFLRKIKYDEELRVIQYVKKIICDIFLQKEIIFYEGLNAIVGDDAASNSIGKSTMLLLHSVSKVKRQINPKLRIDGILMTMVMPRTNISRAIPVKKPPKGEMLVGRISLMKFERGKNGMIYTEIGSVD